MTTEEPSTPTDNRDDDSRRTSHDRTEQSSDDTGPPPNWPDATPGDRFQRGNPVVETYLAAWQSVGDRPFTEETISDRVNRAPETSSDGRAAPIEALVVAGLLRDEGDGQYRVRCTPDESLAGWLSVTEARTEALYDAVQDALGERPSDTDERPAYRTLRGEEYLPIHIDELPVEFAPQLAAVERDLGADPRPGGVVYVAPGELATSVQKLADRLCDDEELASRGCPLRFEKETSTVEGTNADELSFHLFLRETSGSRGRGATS